MAVDTIEVHSDGSDALLVRRHKSGGVEYHFHTECGGGYTIPVTRAFIHIEKMSKSDTYVQVKLTRAQAVIIKTISHFL